MDCLTEDQKRMLSMFTTHGLSVEYTREFMRALKMESPLNVLKSLKDKGLVEIGKDNLGNKVIRRVAA